MCESECQTPLYCAFAPCTWSRIFTLSSGATTVLDTPPATPPAISDFTIAPYPMDNAADEADGDAVDAVDAPAAPPARRSDVDGAVHLTDDAAIEGAETEATEENGGEVVPIVF